MGAPPGYGEGGTRGHDGTGTVAAFQELVSYAGGRRIEGVRLRSDAVVVGVVGRFGPTMTELAGQVRAAVLSAAPGAPRVDVLIDDLDVDVPAWAGVT
ncbi:hypothetical protein UG55_102534 [Frankia sp. EI5c]|nr:hypothetical protein UG55_102534 [Frankia sp. EI5c]